ncbi:MAG: FKBP-type peptidyl-prolyl cis-trans isomerase [Sandaracinaceae bacterium]|nr:FKBP-type peptidyl-prolyl cis-trans isomerase [Sandaracinaceae bacterium]
MNALRVRPSSASFVAGLAATSILGLGLVACEHDEPAFRRRHRDDNAGQPAAEQQHEQAGAGDQAQAHRGADPRLAPRPEGPPAPPDVAAPPADAQRTASGLASRVLSPGTGTAHPTARDRVTVHYTGWTTDGKMFDSSRTRGEPATFPLNGVIAGWTEGLQLMVVGEQRRFWIPEELAYRGRPNRPAGMLVFDVELLAIQQAPEPPQTPPDVAAPPADAQRTPTGLASRVLRPGTGTRHPTADNVVEVHYSGWTTDGQMFDSSVTRGEPAQFPLGGVIAGWTEGVQLMVEGERRRFWIPESLAYQGRPGAPAGMLVFDVELLRIVR